MKKFFSLLVAVAMTAVVNAQTATPHSAEFDCGDNVNVSATAQPHYHFVNWTSDDAARQTELNTNSAYDAATRVATSYFENIGADVDIVANFAINENLLIINPADATMGDVYEADGTTACVYKTPGQDVAYATSITAMAKPDNCYKFTTWEVTTGSDDFKAAVASKLATATITFDMPDEPVVLVAHFEKLRYTVTVAPNDDTMGTSSVPTVRP